MSQSMETPRAYVGIFVALLVLTAATVASCHYHLGPWHDVAGLGIAAAKAILIVLFFMHARHSSRLVWLVGLSGLLWLAILLALTMTDVATRDWSLQ